MKIKRVLNIEDEWSKHYNIKKALEKQAVSGGGVSGNGFVGGVGKSW